jgi:hypothetical protein
MPLCDSTKNTVARLHLMRHIEILGCAVIGALLIPANNNTNQNSYANSDRECGKRPGFGQSVIAGPGTDLDCLIPQAGRLVDGCALATTETFYDVVQDWPNRLGDLVARGGCARGCVSASASSNSAEFLFDGA